MLRLVEDQRPLSLRVVSRLSVRVSDRRLTASSVGLPTSPFRQRDPRVVPGRPWSQRGLVAAAGQALAVLTQPAGSASEVIRAEVRSPSQNPAAWPLPFDFKQNW